MDECGIAIGIDLGTTNTAVAWSEENSLEIAEITQVERPSVVADFAQMPSALYLPLPGEYTEAQLQLPWGEAPQHIIGRFARARAASAPDRVVTSAKSWLCSNSIDRKSAILPWGSELEQGKVSPFEASRLYLRHVYQSLVHKNIIVDTAQIVVTVPASFDEVARSLTAEAAQAAGFDNCMLLEEPLAALYAWIAESGEQWREELRVGDTILVFDVGGGTADFSLILVSENEGDLSLERLSVGEHILLGGDNMDLALAYKIRQSLSDRGTNIDRWQFQSLIFEACRIKERLLSGTDEALPVTIAGKGSDLFASTIQIEVTASEVADLVLDGFLPSTEYSETPVEALELGIQELGLPFASDPALTRHLAAFLRRSNEQVGQRDDLPTNVLESARKGSLAPTVVLFNGGVCKSPQVRSRVLEVVQRWSPETPLRELQGSDCDLAVAKGAAHYGKVRQSGSGLRIRAGIPSSYYLGIESSMPAVPGFRPPLKGICVVPQGMEEGSSLTVPHQVFSLRTGKEVEFRFFSSNNRPNDAIGDIVEEVESVLDETNRMRANLTTENSEERSIVPVMLHVSVNEVGILELWMHATESDQRWKLEFDIRAEKKTLMTAPAVSRQMELTSENSL